MDYCTGIGFEIVVGFGFEIVVGSGFEIVVGSGFEIVAGSGFEIDWHLTIDSLIGFETGFDWLVGFDHKKKVHYQSADKIFVPCCFVTWK